MSAIDFVAGCFGGAAGVLVGHPLDTVKVKLQMQGAGGSVGGAGAPGGGSVHYRGTMHCLLHTYRQEQVRGLYRGMASPLASLAFINAIVFGVYGNAIKLLGNDHSLRNEFLAGSTAGICQTVICSPMELIKSRRQMEGPSGSGRKAGSTSLRSLMRERTLFKGLWPTILRDAPAFGVYFASYQWTLDALQERTWSVLLNHLLAGGVAGSASWLVVYPVDVIKTRIQVFPEKYTSMKQCFRLSVQQEGMGSMTRGLTPAVVRAFPVNAVTFSVVSYTLLTYEQMHQYK